MAKIIKIGLIGESPHDTKSIEKLLKQRYKNNVTYINLIEDIRGSSLDNQKTKSILRKQYEYYKPHIVIIIRDLDALISDRKSINIRNEYFSSTNSVIDRKGIRLLNIYEIEAIILSDLTFFNKFYNTNAVYHGNPSHQPEPKELLMSFCKNIKYSEPDAPDIIENISIDTVITKCYFFAKLTKELDKKIISIIPTYFNP